MANASASRRLTWQGSADVREALSSHCWTIWACPIPRYLALNVFCREDKLTVGAIAERLALEASTLRPLLKRLQAAGLLRQLRDAIYEHTGVGRARPKRAGMGGFLHSRHGSAVDYVLRTRDRRGSIGGQKGNQIGDLGRA